MKKTMLNLGKVLSKLEQKKINGGRMEYDDGLSCSDQCLYDANCGYNGLCVTRPCLGKSTRVCTTKTW